MLNPLKVIEQHLGDIQVQIFAVLEELGLGPEFRTLDDEISGWIERKRDCKYRIVINDRHALVRKRFTAAHELGHYIYHRDLLDSGVGDTRAYRSAGTPLPNSLITQRHERQANSFAANILMPQAQIVKLQGNGVFNPRELAALFGVSEDAMRIRLGLPRQASLFA